MNPDAVVDVVVVGSGAGGGVIAKELGESGLSVVVLEAGRRFDPPNDYPTDQPDFESRSASTFSPANALRDRYTSTGPFSYGRAKGVGGSTLQYWGVSPRLHESDFLVRSREGVGDDWPITYAELEPYYTRVEWELGVSGNNANPFDPPRSRRYPTPAHPLDPVGRAVKRGADRLGLHLTPTPVAIPTANWMGRVACIGAGTCQLGCRIQAKSSIDVTYIPKAEATGRVEIRTESMAREVTLRPDGRARGVVYFDATGVEREIQGRAIVVAGNAVETPRLLLLSKSGRFPDGLANSTGLVGKYFTEHLAVFASGVFPERLDPWRGIPAKGFIQDFYETDDRNGFARGWSIIAGAAQHWPVSVAGTAGGWGTAHKRRMQEIFGHSVGLWSVGEQLPDIRNEVTLDPLQKDSYGLPLPRLTNKLRANDRAMVEKIPGVLTGLLEAAGARETQVDAFRPGNSSHYLATCRMGVDPAASVVDPWCRTHDVRNLFIGDGSVLVTVGAANPALTISALATRTAAGILAAFEAGDL